MKSNTQENIFPWKTPPPPKREHDMWSKIWSPPLKEYLSWNNKKGECFDKLKKGTKTTIQHPFYDFLDNKVDQVNKNRGMKKQYR